MEKNKIIIIGMAVIAFFLCIILIFFSLNTKKNNSNDVHSAILNEMDNNIVDKIDTISGEFIGDIVGSLTIEKLELEDIEVYEGIDDDVLIIGVGHYASTSHWNGNVALNVANHLENLNQLVKGDFIIYKTSMGERRYEVFDTKEIGNADWSMLEGTEENIITIISDIKKAPQTHLCVQAKEII